MKILGLLAGAALLLGAQSASAVTINNGSFETTTPSSATFGTDGYSQENAGSSGIDGWDVDSGSVDIIGTYWTSSDGSQSLDLSGSNAGRISQGLVGLTIGQEYTVSFDLAGNPTGGVKDLRVSAAGTQSLYSFNTAGKTGAAMGWATQTFVFIANAATATLAFLSLTGGSGGPALDNVSIAATPIPGALLLFGSALGGMGFLGYRRKKLEVAA